MCLSLSGISSNYSIPFSEFYKMGEVAEINKMDKVEMIAGKILRSKTLKRVVIITAVVILNSGIISAAPAVAAVAGVDKLGNVLLGIIRSWSKWILILMCLIDTIKAGVSSDSKKILSIVMKYVLLFVLLYMVPVLFDTVSASFQ